MRSPCKRYDLIFYFKLFTKVSELLKSFQQNKMIKKVDNPVAIVPPIPGILGSSSILVKISYLVLIRKIGMIKNRLILTGIFIEMGVIEIEYAPNI